ncbi:uncharacterized protein LOC121388514 [Gigantopelta aegis]|uniref:uncharacterized protein LOC121388514 n=1 Tax=Gigantopelta aegis TaxID=1735272 RepID=UPI001B888B21|nr:uncharacterized protein LOC121388514 [Gigantopelta aegis]
MMSKFSFGQYIFSRLTILFCYTVTVVIVDASECIKVNNCKCSTSTRTIDFSSLNGVGNKPRFSIPDPDVTRPYIYNYNPCKAFISPVSGCMDTKDITVNQQTKAIPPFCFPLGTLSSLKFHGDPDQGTLQIQYTQQVPKPRIVRVNVRCSNSETSLQFKGEEPNLNYKFDLLTNLVCPVTSTSLSTGSILVIIFVLAVIIYFVGGILFFKFVRKAEGVEMVPNLSFWTELPLLIRDGIYFVFRGCKVQTHYEKI